MSGRLSLLLGALLNRSLMQGKCSHRAFVVSLKPELRVDDAIEEHVVAARIDGVERLPGELSK